jgi:hypothetical protein
MSQFNSILSSLGSVAVSLAEKIIPGAGAIGDLINGAKSLSSAFTSIKTANGGTAPADAQEAHDALMAKVNAHADGTLGRLEGGD